MIELADWDSLPQDLAAFAAQLALLEATQRTANALYTLQRAFENDWRTKRRVKCSGPIPIPIPRRKALHPHGCDITDAEIRFAFSLGDHFEDGLPACSEFQVCVTGYVAYDECVVELQDHWRVDTHNFEGEPREPHAFIHFQRGGHAQDEWSGSRNFVPGPELPPRPDDYWQSLLQSPGPRIPFPPVCPVLAIDFVIGQHDGDVWRRLRNSTEYRAIIAKAQERMWKPFFEGLAHSERRRQWLGMILI